jgi:CheY-like chemotaxis protein
VNGIDTRADSDVRCAVTTLIVDDEPDMRVLARVVLEQSGFRVTAEAADGHEAFRKLRELGRPAIPTVILLDNQMPGPSGLEVAARILRCVPDQLIVIFSAYLNDEFIAEAERLGVAACVPKAEALNLGAIVTRLLDERA